MHIGIAGGTGAGKTTVARRVTDGVDSVRVVPLDNYYRDRSDLEPAERAGINYDHPDAFDWELVRNHLDALAAGDAVEMPQYDFERHVRREETVRVEPGAVVVVEGILALYDEAVRDRLDLSTVKPMHERFVRPTKRTADLVIPEGANEKAVSLLRQYVRAAV
jgi:uridine kinase